MNLPQEYWEKQTLFEIAFGLGTPLIIDENTQNKKFGIFARVLVDVDLSDKLFEYVVIERDDHALSILVQYEKHPLYCAHCKMLGYSLQTSSKLNTSNNYNGSVHLSQKTHHAPSNTMTKTGLSGKQVMNNSGNDMTRTGWKGKPASGSSSLTGTRTVTADSDRNQKNGKCPDKQQLNTITELEEGEILSSQKVLPTQTEVHDANNTSNPELTLQNSFDLLVDDDHPVEGEARPVDGDLSPLTVEDDLNISCKVVKDPMEKDVWIHPVVLEAPESLNDGPSKTVACIPNNPKKVTKNGRQVFPIVQPSPLVQCSHTGRLSFPSAVTKSAGQALDRDLNEHTVLQPIITPITTTNETLGLDKRKVNLVEGPKNMSAAYLQSGIILSKFWGDEQDTNADSTFDLESELEAHKLKYKFADSSHYLAPLSEPAKKSKRGRPKKQKSPKYKLAASEQIQTQSSGEHSSDFVTTRSKTSCKLQISNKSQ